MIFDGTVRVGVTLDCEAKIVQNSVRAGFRFIGVGMTVRDQDGRQVVTAKSTIMVPA